MIEIEVTSGQGPQVLAELIASTVHGHPVEAGSPTIAETGRMVRVEQEKAEGTRPSWQQMETLNFTTIDPESDWTDV